MKKYFKIDNISKYRNMLMGIMIVEILIFHYTLDCRNMSYNFTGWIVFYIKYIGSSGVDIFLLLSGFGLYYSFKKNSNTEEFYKKRYKKILIPYVIFCIPVLAWQYIFFFKLGIVRFIKEVSFYGLFRYGSTLFWYILMICLCYFIFPYIFKVFNSTRDNMTTQMRLILLITVSYVFNIMLDIYYHSLFNKINIVTLRFAPFIFGVFLGKCSFNKAKVSYSKIVLFIVFSLLLLPLMKSNKTIVFRTSLALLKMSICLVMILLFNLIEKTKIFKYIKIIFEKIGEYTLELYITHVALRVILSHNGYPTCRIRNYLLVIIISVILSIIIKWLTKLILKLFNFNILKKKTRTS